MDPAVGLLCLIIGIADGHTLTARCETLAGMENTKVRMAEIDAPEKAQAFGKRSRQHLSDICFKKSATVVAKSKDRRGRTVTRVACASVDASAEQVRAGMAWVYDKYATDPALYALQDQARAARRGPWSDAEPLAPWMWRSGARPNGGTATP